jgi:hypothetical protein
MRITKGTTQDHRTQYYEYAFKGQMYWVQGELAYNEKRKRYEHIHYGRRGGKHLIIWKDDIR